MLIQYGLETSIAPMPIQHHLFPFIPAMLEPEDLKGDIGRILPEERGWTEALCCFVSLIP